MWRRKPRDDQPPAEPMPDKQRLEELLYRLADLIGDDDEGDRFWSGKVRESADLVRAGQVGGLRKFLGLFGGMGSINDQRFSGVLESEISAPYSLASALLAEQDYEASSHARERDVVLRPWSEGHTGKAVVYEDGTVIATEDDAEGVPHFDAIKDPSRDEPPVALLGIKPDGSCDAYRYHCDERWLAARLHDHHSGLHLEQEPPRA